MIDVEGLTKRFGDLTAVDGLSFRVEAGEIVGLLGPNGAGKTTTLEILMGLVRPSMGTARMAGVDVVRASDDVKRIAGYMPENPRLFEHLTGWDYLGVVAEAHALEPSLARDRASAILESLRMLEEAPKRMGTYSQGTRRKIALAAAVLHCPRVLLLDEPHAALDPSACRALEALVRDAVRSGAAALVSTHQLVAAQRLCRRVAIVHRGRLLAIGTPDELVRTHAPDVRSDSRTGGPSPRAPDLEDVFLALVDRAE